MHFSNFLELGLSESVLQAIADVGYTSPTPVQAQVIPSILSNQDILASAQTGTGKTASFTLPMIDKLTAGRARARMPRSLVLEPTRELATQVSENFKKYSQHSKLKQALLIGGESSIEQERILDKGVDVLIATPGRLLDLFERGKILLPDIKILVIDEADRMMDMGFLPDVEKILTLLSKNRQTLLFSATIPNEIRRLSKKFQNNPVEITIETATTIAENIKQQFIHTTQKDKTQLLKTILTKAQPAQALIFCNRKTDISHLNTALKRSKYLAAPLHGDLTQLKRTETLQSFKDGQIKFLVCSDVAARGLDIENLPFVFNFDVPKSVDDYIHRVGRTGRAGQTGIAITFVTPEETKIWQQIIAIGKNQVSEYPLAKPSTPKPASNKTPKPQTKDAKKKPIPAKVQPQTGLQDNMQPRVAQAGKKTGFGDHVPAFFQPKSG